jgi:hypothetical protein
LGRGKKKNEEGRTKREEVGVMAFQGESVRFESDQFFV